MTHIVFIEGLTINTVIGVYSWERAIHQSLVIDVKLYGEMSKSFLSDDVNDAINYKSVCEDIERICHDTRAKLLESLADKIMAYLFCHYPCTKIELTIKKPNAIKQATSVGVMLICTKDDYANIHLSTDG